MYGRPSGVTATHGMMTPTGTQQRFQQAALLTGCSPCLGHAICAAAQRAPVTRSNTPKPRVAFRPHLYPNKGMLSEMKPYTGFTTQGSPASPVRTATCIHTGTTRTTWSVFEALKATLVHVLISISARETRAVAVLITSAGTGWQMLYKAGACSPCHTL